MGTMPTLSQYVRDCSRTGQPASLSCHVNGDAWLMSGLSRHRDSGVLDNTNFDSAEECLREACYCGGCVETHRFSHWAVGWIEYLTVSAAHTACAENVRTVADSLIARLADYPVLDEHALSAAESELRAEAWGGWGRDTFCTELRKRLYAKGYSDDVEDLIPSEDVVDSWWKRYNSDPYGFEEGGGWCFSEFAATAANAEAALVAHVEALLPKRQPTWKFTRRRHTASSKK